MTSAQGLGPEQRRQLRALAEHLQGLATGTNEPPAPADPVVQTLAAACVHALSSPPDGQDHYLHQELLQRMRAEPQLLDWLEAGSLDGLWYWDLEHPEHEWLSPRFKEVFGYRPDEIPHSSAWWQANIFQEDLPGVLRTFQAHVEQGAPFDQIVRYRHKDGSTRWVRCRGLVLRDAGGRPVRMLGAHTDVTALKEAEVALRANNAELERQVLERTKRLQQTVSDSVSQERLFRQVVDYAPNGKLVISNDGVITYANRQVARIFGYQIEELIGKPVEVLVPADIRTRHVGLRLNYASDPTPRPMGAGRQLRGVRKDGSEVPIEIGLSPVDLPTGPAVMAAIVDISDRVRAEALQQEILRQQRELIEGLPQLVWTCRADGSCDFLGRQWVAYTGIPEAEQLGSGWLAQVHPEDRPRLLENWQQSFSTGATFDVEFRIRRHDGVYRWFKTRATQLRDAEGKVSRWFGTNTDIDEQKQLERFLRERTTELERSNRDLEHFAFAASHDLREPLRKVRTFSTMISGLLLPEQQEAHDLVQRMDRAGQRMQALVDGLLTYSRLRSTRVSWSLVDLDALVTDVRDDLALAITEQGALIEVGPLGHLRGDRGQLYSLFLNLMSNAIKFHAPQVPPHLTISAERTANRLVVQWRDRGLGFPEEATRHAFELFTRFHDTRQFQGSGLGLATARKVVELHGGVITLESKAGQGACFTAEFPIEPAS